MILIPQILFAMPGVETLLRDGDNCILRKTLSEPVEEREGYVSQHVVSLVLSGEQRICTNEETRTRVCAGEMVFMPRGIYNVSDLLPERGKFDALLFYFNRVAIEGFLSQVPVDKRNRNDEPTCLKFEQGGAIQVFTQALIDLYQRYPVDSKAFLNLKISELLHLIRAQTGDRAFANYLFRITLPTKRNLRSFMENHALKPLKIEDYASLSGRSISTFRRDFKAQFDCTPQQWLKSQRLVKAQQLLEEQSMSVAEVALAVGYDNVSYFIQEFKKRVGRSPKQHMLYQRSL